MAEEDSWRHFTSLGSRVAKQNLFSMKSDHNNMLYPKQVDELKYAYFLLNAHIKRIQRGFTVVDISYEILDIHFGVFL